LCNIPITIRMLGKLRDYALCVRHRTAKDYN